MYTTESLEEHLVQRIVQGEWDQEHDGEEGEDGSRFDDHGCNTSILRAITVSKDRDDALSEEEETKDDKNSKNNVKGE